MPISLRGDVTSAVIPAAGLGTRLRPLTNAFPKEMLPVGRLPVMAHVVAELRGAGVTRAVFIVSEAKPQIRSYFGERFAEDGDGMPPLECSYLIQNEQRGLGHAIGLAREWAEGSTFIVAFGDCIIESDRAVPPLQRLVDLHFRRNSSASTLVEEVGADKVSRYGIISPARSESVTFDAEIELQDIVEKPKAEDAPSCFAVAARWVLEPAIFDLLDAEFIDPRGEINLTDAVRRLKQNGASLWAAKLAGDEARRDIGNFGTFFDAFVRAAMRDSEYGVEVTRTVHQELLRGKAAIDAG